MRSSKQKTEYKPFGGGVSRKMVHRAASKAATRAESYSFKSRNGAPGDVAYMLSSEMLSLAAERSSLLDPANASNMSRWEDRSSMLAAPVQASDMYLMSVDGSSSLQFNGPRFYHDELSTANDDPVSGMPVPPDVTRFPYSDEAHAASKVLSAKLAKNLARRHYAAAVLQRSYRAMIAMRRFRKEVFESHMAARRLQWLWKKRLFNIRARHAEKDRLDGVALVLQCMARQWLARRKVHMKKVRKLRYSMMVMVRFFVYAKKELKRKRGRKVRHNVHAARLQAVVRGKQCRRGIRRMHWAWQRIRQCYLNYFFRIKGKFAVRLFHFLRRSWVHRKAHKVQSVARGFLGRRRHHRARLAVMALDRQNQTNEIEFVAKELERDIRERCFSWTVQPSLRYGNELPRDTPKDLMRFLDACSRCVLCGPIKGKDGSIKERRIQAIDAELSLDALEGGSKRMTALAVLTAFSNRPSGTIDCYGLELCKPYLVPTRNTSSSDSSGSADAAWDKLIRKATSQPITILVVSALLEPTVALRMRVAVQGHLPDALLAQAVLLRRWTHHTDYVAKRALWKAREGGCAPKFSCPDCLQPFGGPRALRIHAPCQRFGMLGWLSQQYFALPVASLHNRITALAQHPAVERKSLDEDRQGAALKVNSRREIARKRCGAFASAADRHKHVLQLQDLAVSVDPSKRSDKKALRLAREEKDKDDAAKKAAATGKTIPGSGSPGRAAYGSSKSKKSPGGSSTGGSPAASPGKGAIISPSSSSKMGSPSSKNGGAGGFAVPPPGVEYIPFMEEYSPPAIEMLREMTEEAWLDVPGRPPERPVNTKDKDGKITNFEFQPNKEEMKAAKKAAKAKAASSKKK